MDQMDNPPDPNKEYAKRKEEYKQAILEKDFEKVNSVVARFADHAKILRDIVFDSLERDGKLAMWVVENFEESMIPRKTNEPSEPLSKESVLITLVYSCFTHSVEKSQQNIAKLKESFDIADTIIKCVAENLLYDGRFIKYMNSDDYISFANTFMGESEYAKKIHVNRLTNCLWDPSEYEPEDIKKIIDHYNLSKKDIEENGGMTPSDRGSGFYGGLRKRLEHVNYDLQDYSHLMSQFPEFKQELYDFKAKEIKEADLFGEIRYRDNKLEVFQEYWKFITITGIHDDLFKEAKEKPAETPNETQEPPKTPEEYKKREVLKIMHAFVKEKDYATALTFAKHYKEELGIDQQLCEKLKEKSS